MIASTINQKIAEALKAKDEIRLSTLRMLSSALNYERIAKQHDLSEEEELVVVQKEAKKRKDAIEAYEKAGATDRADKEKTELDILKKYLPVEMSAEELVKIINEVVGELRAEGMKDAGKVIGAVMNKVAGRAEGSKVAEIVKSKLL
ncbi:hypothetical protein A2685_02155 [Candidatus Woesebacteria bacterium RIFCSPHIGHO2_01_FULL_37_10]|uniref:Glutamyl-tRNA amidotransferase n=1 Tax=Candidatus Woesebacteria bacterium RIFCSPHIGHO2_01_FULL_37_10 TaxID=1802489 RepID=A0A1F7XWG1_9BACT|nr:MAG: hypothetical protein A2685_02155 [Candidatus Woesebacteria bacterium RIFCSPHIGHO2_01_FULL_37_10]